MHLFSLHKWGQNLLAMSKPLSPSTCATALHPTAYASSKHPKFLMPGCLRGPSGHGNLTPQELQEGHDLLNQLITHYSQGHLKYH